MSVARTQRQEWIDFLEANDYFDDVPLIPENKKDLENEITRALGSLAGKGGKKGIAVIFLTATAAPTTDGGHGPVLELVHIARCIENPMFNDTGKSYEDVAEKIAALTHGNFQPVSGNSPFVLDPPGIVLGNDENLPSKDVHFRCTGYIGIDLDQVDTPTGAVQDGTLTLSCATAGAAIFYSIDNPAPNPRSGTLYTAPVAVDAGKKIKARAWLPGYLASAILKLSS